MIKKILAFILLAQMFLFAEFRSVDITDAQKMIKKSVPVIDIRTPSEWRETGVIKGSHKIMFFNERGGYNIDKWMSEFQKVVKDKNQPFILVCRTASRTKMVGQFLDRDMGYKKVYDLKGGITNWLRKGKEVAR